MAIAFDAASSNQGSDTLSHTCTGSDLFLFVYPDRSGAVSGITYDGVALTLIGGTDLWYLVGPHTGTHNIVVSGAGGEYIIGAVSLSGVQQAAPSQYFWIPSALSTSITTTFNDTWMIDVLLWFNMPGGSPVAPSVQRWSETGYSIAPIRNSGSSTQDFPTPGVYPVARTTAGSQQVYGGIILLPSTVPISGNIKSVSGVSFLTNVKSVETINSADIKEVGGVTN